jgi:hypothetical protein
LVQLFTQDKRYTDSVELKVIVVEHFPMK